MLRATFPKAKDWHTLLGKPEVKPVTVTIPAGYGYVLTSKKTRRRHAAVVDIEFLQKEVFKQLPKQDGKLVFAGDAQYDVLRDGRCDGVLLVGNAWRGRATGNSFVLASYLHNAPAVIRTKTCSR